MGRPQKPLERDGSPVREFAFWLRDLRNRSGLTYAQLGKSAHYATSTVQDATAGRRLPTLRVTTALVEACGGDLRQWRAYWAQIQRTLDQDAPNDCLGSISPPWAGQLSPGGGPDGDAPSTDSSAGRPRQSGRSSRAVAGEVSARGEDPASVDGVEGWFVESFSALLRLDTEPVEALEQRVIVAASDGLSELETSVSVPRHPTDADAEHTLESELMYGGSLELREQPYESYFKNVIVLPRPLRKGERCAYALRLRIPVGQLMASHYVYIPFRRSDHFELRVRFNPGHPPRAVWMLSGAPTAVIYERGPVHETLAPDRFGEVHVSFCGLRLGFGYGVCWQE
jgi:hypothetical protein